MATYCYVIKLGFFAQKNFDEAIERNMWDGSLTRLSFAIEKRSLLYWRERTFYRHPLKKYVSLSPKHKKSAQENQMVKKRRTQCYIFFYPFFFFYFWSTFFDTFWDSFACFVLSTVISRHKTRTIVILKGTYMLYTSSYNLTSYNLLFSNWS